MKKQKMQDELTEAMHSEFWVDDETEIEHKVWCVCREVLDGSSLDSSEDEFKRFGITRADFDKHVKSYPYYNDFKDLFDLI